MIRLFVGIDFDSQTKDALASICYGIPDMRWVSRQNLHYTLQFIGEVDAFTYDRIVEKLESIPLQIQDPIKLNVKGVGYFAHARNQYTVWAAVEPNRQILALHKNVEHSLNELLKELKPRSMQTFQSEDKRKKIIPHITLGRSAGPCSSMDIADYLSAHASFVGPKIRSHDFTLFSSKLKPTGAVYQVEEVFPTVNLDPPLIRDPVL